MNTTSWLMVLTLVVPTGVNAGKANEAASSNNARAAKSVGAAARSMTLRQAHELALARNPNAKNIQESIVQAGVQIQRAWAIFIPSLSANGAVTRNNQEIALEVPDPTTGNLQKVVIQELWGRSFGFSANLTLFNARSYPLLRNAYDNVEMAEKSGEHQRNDLLFMVSSAYYQTRSAQELVAVARDDLTIAKEFLRMSRAQQAVGQGTRIDVLRAELQQVNAEKELANAEDALTLSKSALAYLIDDHEPFHVVDTQPVEPVEGDLKVLTTKALNDRLDVQAGQLAQTMADRDINETWAQWVPAVDVTYAWDWNSAGGFAGSNDSWRLIFGAKWTLIDRGLRLAELRERHSRLRAATNNLQQITLQVSEEVERQHVELERAKRNVGLATKQTQVAEENYRLVSRQYELGMANSLDVLNAATELSRARTARVVEELQSDLAALALNKAVGNYQTR